jgi:integrase
MGRKPTVNQNAMPGLRPRRRRGKVYYYFDTGGKPRVEIPLGSDYVLAVGKWAELTKQKAPKSGLITFRYVAECYVRDALPTKAPRTRKDNLKELAWLYRFFDDPPVALDEIEPVHISQYKAWRVRQAKEDATSKAKERGKPAPVLDPLYGHVRSNREKALFSHIWNYAREKGLTAASNPCLGIKGYTEEGRDVSVDDALLNRLLAVACKPLEFALRLADITSQRPGDCYKMSETDIRDDILHVKQGKTKTPLRFKIVGSLKVLLDEIFEYKRQFAVRSLSLLVTEDGQPMNEYTMRSRLDKARAAAGIAKNDLQFRDMRPKAATEADEAGGTRKAQDLLGHTTEGMTVTYIRRKAGKLITPRK